jgi:ERCC4-type nuclease
MQYKEKDIKKIIDSICIIVDTKEKDKYIVETFDKYNISYIHESLKSGDYSFKIPKIEGLVDETDFRDEMAIERKNSLSEISQNLTKHKERFKREFERTEAKIIVMIEDSYKNCAYGNYKSNIDAKSLLGLLHSWEFKYDTNIVYIDKEVAPLYIYNTFKYYLRAKLKGLKTD